MRELIGLCIILAVCGIWDYRRKKIPNILILIMAAWYVHFLWHLPDFWTGWLHVLVSLVVFAVFYPLYKVRMLGAGDVKILTLCCGFYMPKQVLIFLFMAFVFAGILASLISIVLDDFMTSMGHAFTYFSDVVREGRFGLYMVGDEECGKLGVALTGPILCSVLLTMGVWYS